jgi:predicted ATPase/DNA-binding XRE family transcriptional regulator
MRPVGILSPVEKRGTERGAPGTFAGRLRELRRAAGLTQEELAARAGLSPAAVGTLERGVRSRPYPHTVRALADALNASEEERAALLASVPERGGVTPPVTEAVSPPPLPGHATAIVGRERELAGIAGLLTAPETRLLTLTGPGGVGKTRLATEAARTLLDRGRFRDGVAFVELAPLTDPALVLTAAAQALGLREAVAAGGRTPAEVLRLYLQGGSFLLVLDNLEQVIEAAPEVADLVESCTDLTVLATSRAPLRVRGEQEYPVPPLPLPDLARNPTEDQILESPSGRLFLERARSVSPEFRIDGDNAADVARICRRLAGLPLAIELAAAKIRFLDPASLLSRLDQVLSAAPARDLPERQRTMRSTLDWSHGLLTEPQRILFRRLSVFAGGFTLPAAEAVGENGGRAEGVLEELGALTEQSLVTVDRESQDGARYGMLEPVKQYAFEMLEGSGEAAEARRRHAEHFVALAQTADPALLGPDHAIWLGRLEREHDNLREALRWARESGDVRTGLRLAGELGWFWWMRAHLHEGRRWTEEFLGRDAAEGSAPDLGPARAKAVLNAGRLAFGQGDLDRAAGILEEGVDLYRRLGDERGAAFALAELGQLLRARGEHDRAAALSEEGLALGRGAGDTLAAAIALNTLGHIARHRGDSGPASALHAESLAMFRTMGNERGIAYALASLGIAALESGELERAEALGDESLSLYEKLGDKAGMALALVAIGDVARERGDERRALTLYDEALALHHELGNERGIARVLGRLDSAPERTGPE